MSIIYNGEVVAGVYKEQIIQNADTINKGIIKIATQEEVDTGVNNSTAVTPLYLAQKQDKLTTGDNIEIKDGVITGTLKPDNNTAIKNADNTFTIIGQKTKANTIKINWEGTTAEYEQAWLNGDIEPDWYCYITDDESFVDYGDVLHQNLDNLTVDGEEKINISKMYLTGKLSSDTKGYIQLKQLKDDSSQSGADIFNGIIIPYTLSKTGSKIVDIEHRDKVLQIYETNGIAPYYIIDEVNQQFSLPMGEIYGMIQKINDKQEEIVENITSTVANKDLSNLTEEGEKHFLNYSQITNCITEVPQRIKYTLKDGVLTIKAGSVVIIPNGFEENEVTKKFNHKVLTSDLRISSVNNTTPIMLYITPTNGLDYMLIDHSFSGDATPVFTGNYAKWYDTANNLVKATADSGSTWINGYSLPLMIVTPNSTVNTTINAINQVFNGFGYIGSTVWVDKDVKVLIPNGRNEDGTLKNIEKESIVYINNYTPTTDANYTYYLLLTTNNELTKVSSFDYDSDLNIIISSVGNNGTVVGKINMSNKTISDAIFYKPLQILENKTPHLIETYQNDSSWYRIWSDGWCEQGGTAPTNTSSVTFLKKFTNADTIYINAHKLANSNEDTWHTMIRNITTTSFTLQKGQYSSAAANLNSSCKWEAKGYIS